MKNNKGFTLMEMLIVVAIIGVISSISIISLNNTLEIAREATDLANIKQVCTKLTEFYLLDTDIPSNFTYLKSSDEIRTCIQCQGKESGWQTKDVPTNGATFNGAICYAADKTKPYLCIYVNKTTGKFRFVRETSAKNPMYN